ncbi:hypothetical protein [Bradyrhizobium manausense]|uniref:hypothetical protein n=1 Tax=Bradyrhizobium manausense TaxID=989370 RepID=UPI0012EDEAF6|nr:hypothetical protein [Bradyrhizobium manausense]
MPTASANGDTDHVTIASLARAVLDNRHVAARRRPMASRTVGEIRSERLGRVPALRCFRVVEIRHEDAIACYNLGTLWKEVRSPTAASIVRLARGGWMLGRISSSCDLDTARPLSCGFGTLATVLIRGDKLSPSDYPSKYE